MTKEFEKLVVDSVKKIIPRVERYREKNVTKYNAEAAGEHGGEYSVKEKYKNRVRVVDIFLPIAKEFVEGSTNLVQKKRTLQLNKVKAGITSRALQQELKELDVIPSLLILKKERKNEH